MKGHLILTMKNMTEEIKRILLQEYGVTVISAEKSQVGAGSDTWFINCKDDRYVIKYPSESEINNPRQEPELCEYLNQSGIPVCRFIKNKKGEYLTTDPEGKTFHLQRFFKGKMYDWHEAPPWLLTQSARMLGKIHTALKDYQGLPVGIGSDFFTYMTPERALESYRYSLSIAKEQKHEEVIEDLQYRIELMERFPRLYFDLSKLTCQATHGDFFISQLLCGENKINAVIDWTTACIHPVVWEIVRSYVYAAPSCKEGNIHMEEFAEYVEEYRRFAPLTEYDLQNMIPLFYYQIAVCDYYGQYYGTDTGNRHIYLQQAKLSTKLLKWFEAYGEELTDKLIRKEEYL